MKKMLFAILMGLLFPVSAFAESIQIFEATPVSYTYLNPISNFAAGEANNYGKLWAFAQKEISLTCSDFPLVTLSAPVSEGGSVIVDNIMYVNDTNVCDLGSAGPGVVGPAGVYNCFRSGTSAYVGNPIQNTFSGIGVVNISGLIPSGTSTVVFSLKDWGSVYGNTSLILNVEGCTINGSQGCTPGYWKNHLEAWLNTGYSNGTPVVSVFNTASPYLTGDVTLLDALKFKGGAGLDGAVRILLRAAVAALLNSTSSDVAYPTYAPYLIVDVNNAISTGNRDTMLLLADELDLNNNLGCPL